MRHLRRFDHPHLHQVSEWFGSLKPFGRTNRSIDICNLEAQLIRRPIIQNDSTRSRSCDVSRVSNSKGGCTPFNPPPCFEQVSRRFPSIGRTNRSRDYIPFNPASNNPKRCESNHQTNLFKQLPDTDWLIEDSNTQVTHSKPSLD